MTHVSFPLPRWPRRLRPPMAPQTSSVADKNLQLRRLCEALGVERASVRDCLVEALREVALREETKELLFARTTLSEHSTSHCRKCSTSASDACHGVQDALCSSSCRMPEYESIVEALVSNKPRLRGPRRLRTKEQVEAANRSANAKGAFKEMASTTDP